MARFVFDSRRNSNNEVALYDTRRGRNTIIGMIDIEYVPALERAFALLENAELAKKVAAEHAA